MEFLQKDCEIKLISLALISFQMRRYAMSLVNYVINQAPSYLATIVDGID